MGLSALSAASGRERASSVASSMSMRRRVSMREGGSLSSNLANAGHLVRRRPEFDRVESKKK